MEIPLSERVRCIQPSPTLAVTAYAAELRAQGYDIINLGAGEPDFTTPEPIRRAAHGAIDAGHTHYTAVDGIPALKQAVRDKLQRDNDLEYQPEEVIVSCGGKQVIFNLALAILEPGDQVIIPAPYWVSYPDIVKLAGAEPVPLMAEQEAGFKITPSQLAQALSERSRLLVLNSPTNPTGAVYTAEELAALADVLRYYRQVVILSDDIYEKILFQGSFHNILNVAPELKARVVVLNGVSKAYAMTGWRIGYAAGPAELVAAMKKIQSQSTSNPASISQHAALAALNEGAGLIQPMVDAFHQRHDYLVGALNQLPGISCRPADGAFYLFPSFHAVLRDRPDLEDDVALARHLLGRAGVALVPGSAFGAPGYMRLSFATELDALKEAITRLHRELPTG